MMNGEMESVVDIRNLGKTFPGGVVAIDGLDMAVPRSAVYGLIGRNGAGKTTTLRILMGLLKPTRGSATVQGHNLQQAPHTVREAVTYVSQTQRLHDWMTLNELCSCLDLLYRKWDSDYARRLAARFELPLNRPIGTMSGGEQRKSAILLALAPRPDVLVMDEPAAGLDPIARRELIDVLIETLGDGDGHTVIFSTHIISDLERIADYVGIMDHGRMVTSSSLEDLQTSTRRIQIIFEGNQVPENFKLAGAVKVETSGPVYTAVVQTAGDLQAEVLSMRYTARVNVFPLGLEDIFISIFGPDSKQELQGE
jgi:ABC-2 type transport system ATP-binding protein